MNVAANRKLSVIERMHKTVFASSRPFDDFELAIIGELRKKLDVRSQEILSSQLELINSNYRDYDDEKKILTIYYYWNFFGKSRNDFPIKWRESEKERRLAIVEVIDNEEQFFTAELFVVLGRFFFIKLSSNCEELSPISPDYKFKHVEVFDVEYPE
jgi:hypothetical protein